MYVLYIVVMKINSIATSLQQLDYCFFGLFLTSFNGLDDWSLHFPKYCVIIEYDIIIIFFYHS